MASGALGGTLRYLRDLIHDGTAVGLGDGQLLARYTQSRDEAAFEALLGAARADGPGHLPGRPEARARRRRRLPSHVPRARLQGARSAPATPWVVGCTAWLTARPFETSDQSRRRQRLEAETAAMTPLKTTGQTENTDNAEIPAIVHEELDRLPDRQRLPLILCDLEGLTYNHAAPSPAVDRADAAAPARQGSATAAGSSDSARGHRRGGRRCAGRLDGRGSRGGHRGAGSARRPPLRPAVRARRQPPP